MSLFHLIFATLYTVLIEGSEFTTSIVNGMKWNNNLRNFWVC